VTPDDNSPTPDEPRDDARDEPVDDGRDPSLAAQRCVNCGSTQLTQDTNGLWTCSFCRSTFRADDPAMIVVDSPEVRQANDNVVDTADMLTYEQQQAVGAHLRGLKKKHDVVIVVETVNTITQNVEYYARKRAHELGVGDAAKDNGIYILLVRQPRRVQVQAGNGISTYLNSDDINVVVAAQMVPKFKAGDLVSGLIEGADALVDSYLDNKATNRVRTDSRASGPSAAAGLASVSPSSGSKRYQTGNWRSQYGNASSGSRNNNNGSSWRWVPFVLVLLLLIWMFASGNFGGGGGGGGGYDGGSDSGWDSGGWDSGGGGWDSGGGSDYGGGGFDSGSGGGSDW